MLSRLHALGLRQLRPADGVPGLWTEGADMTAAAPSPDAPMVEWAIWYATARGWPVLPWDANRKRPAGGLRWRDATRDPEQIMRLWTRFFGAGIATFTGAATGVCVVDDDPRNGSQASLSRLAGEGKTLPSTLTARTPRGGRHRYYTGGGALLGQTPLPGYPGVDILCDVASGKGHIVVLPPTRRSDGSYSWETAPTADVALIPLWLLRALPEPTDSRPTPSHGLTGTAGPSPGWSPPDDELRAATLVLRPYYRTGQRRLLALALAGVLVHRQVAVGRARDLGRALAPDFPFDVIEATYARAMAGAPVGWQEWIVQAPGIAPAIEKLLTVLPSPSERSSPRAEPLLRLPQTLVDPYLAFVGRGDLPTDDAMNDAQRATMRAWIERSIRDIIKASGWTPDAYASAVPPEFTVKVEECGKRAVIMRVCTYERDRKGKPREVCVHRYCGHCAPCTAHEFALKLWRAYIVSASRHGVDLVPIVLRAHRDDALVRRIERRLTAEKFGWVWTLHRAPADARSHRALIAWVTPGARRRLLGREAARHVRLADIARCIPTPNGEATLASRVTGSGPFERTVHFARMEERLGIGGPRAAVKRSGLLLCNDEEAREALKGLRPLLAVFPLKARAAAIVEGTIAGRLLPELIGLEPTHPNLLWVTAVQMNTQVRLDVVDLRYYVRAPAPAPEPPHDTVRAAV